MGQRSAEVDAYLAGLDEARREALQAVRDLVHAAVPEVVETLRYRMPTFELEGMLCAMASQKHYISLYVDVGLLAKHRAALEHLDLGKSCIRFRKLESIPLDTIRAILTETAQSQRKT